MKDPCAGSPEYEGKYRIDEVVVYPDIELPEQFEDIEHRYYQDYRIHYRIEGIEPAIGQDRINEILLEEFEHGLDYPQEYKRFFTGVDLHLKSSGKKCKPHQELHYPFNLLRTGLDLPDYAFHVIQCDVPSTYPSYIAGDLRPLLQGVEC
jgi:hypothetical protein